MHFNYVRIPFCLCQNEIRLEKSTGTQAKRQIHKLQIQNRAKNKTASAEQDNAIHAKYSVDFQMWKLFVNTAETEMCAQHVQSSKNGTRTHTRKTI